MMLIGWSGGDSNTNNNSQLMYGWLYADRYRLVEQYLKIVVPRVKKNAKDKR